MLQFNRRGGQFDRRRSHRPPYGISFQNNYWDKDLPNRQIWQDCLRVLKPGSFGLIFSSIRLMHRLMVDVEESGFLIKDVLFWAYLNGMPKSRDLGLEIDKELGVESKKVGKYRYVQGYKKGGADNYYATQEKYRYEPASELGIKYKGAGLGIKPALQVIHDPNPVHAQIARELYEDFYEPWCRIQGVNESD